MKSASSNHQCLYCETSMQQTHLNSTMLDRQTKTASHTVVLKLTSTISLHWLPCSCRTIPHQHQVRSLKTPLKHWAHSQWVQWSFSRLLQHFIRSVLLLWHSLLIYRGLLLLFGKGRPRSLWMQKKFALTSKKECTAGKIGARIPSGGGCEGRGGSRRTCTALLRFRQTCSRRQARSPERRRWQSSGAWRCPRDQRVRHRPWELHWEPDTGGILSNTHRQSRTSAVLTCSRCDRFWREMQCQL